MMLWMQLVTVIILGWVGGGGGGVVQVVHAFQSVQPYSRGHSSSLDHPLRHSSAAVTTTTTRAVGFHSNIQQQQPPKRRRNHIDKSRDSSTRLYFMGSDGGILGVGTPEVLTILLVGYFVLGPSDLYKLVKEIGKFIQNVRTMGTDLSSQLENNLESQLQLQELRKAQSELSDAFSFRRSINVDPQSEAFSTTPNSFQPDGSAENPQAAVAETTGAAAAATAAPARPKKIRRRIRRPSSTYQQDVGVADNNYPADLTMPSTTSTATTAATKATTTRYDDDGSSSSSMTKEELETIEREFDQYTLGVGDASSSKSSSPDDDWYSSSSSLTDSFTDPASTTETSPEYDAAAQSRFQQQMSGNWNEQVLANEDKLSPLATVMNKIALLEKEKKAATQRLQEEFEKRAALDEEYFQEQRRLLEDAARQVQENALGLDAGDLKPPVSSASSRKEQNTTAEVRV